MIDGLSVWVQPRGGSREVGERCAGEVDGGAEGVLRLQQVLKPQRVPTVIFDWNLRLVGATDAAQEILRTVGGNEAEELLERIRAVAERARWEWHELLRTAKRPGRVLAVDGEVAPGLEVRVSTLPPADRELGRPTFCGILLAGRRTGGVATLGWLALLGAAELEVVERVCRGWTNQAIADGLGRSVSTVKSELRSSFRKLRVKNRAELVAVFAGVWRLKAGEVTR